jgi:hypothetical protein
MTAQKPSWESHYFMGIYYSPVNGDGLNDVMTDNGLPELSWSPVGFSQFFLARKK